METLKIPWVFCIVTAIWFGWMARRAGRASTLWAVGGAAFGLVISTLVIGLGVARSIPFSGHDQAAEQTRWIVAAALLILILGWLLTFGLHRHHLLIRRTLKPEPGLPDATALPAKPGPATTAKPSPGKTQP